MCVCCQCFFSVYVSQVPHQFDALFLFFFCNTEYKCKCNTHTHSHLIKSKLNIWRDLICKHYFNNLYILVMVMLYIFFGDFDPFWNIFFLISRHGFWFFFFSLFCCSQLLCCYCATVFHLMTLLQQQQQKILRHFFFVSGKFFSWQQINDIYWKIVYCLLLLLLT